VRVRLICATSRRTSPTTAHAELVMGQLPARWLGHDSSKIAKEKMRVCSVLNTVAIGFGLLETVAAAKPTKEDKIRRKAKKAQHKPP
jgi:hypothetical protein